MTDAVYVGMTTRYKQRMREDNRRFPDAQYDKYPLATGLSKKYARAMEQTLITA